MQRTSLKGRLRSPMLLLAALTAATTIAQVDLTTSPYTQNFNTVASGLPTGWTVRTGASASALGTVASFNTAAVLSTSTTGQFGNFTSQDGTRCIGLRQTGSFADNGAAFVLQLANTTGASNLAVSFTLMDLANQPRTTTWNVDYGVGTSPTSWTNLTTSPAPLTTGGTGSETYAVTATLPAAVNNSAQNVWVRVVTKSATGGSGNRTSTGIDNFSLSFTTATPPTATFTQLTTGMAASPLVASSTAQALLGFAATSNASGSTAPTAQLLNGLSITTSSNSTASLSNIRLVRSMDNSAATTGDNTVIGTFTQNAGTLQLTGLSEALNATVKNYFIIADVSAGVTPATASLTLTMTQASTTLSGGNENTYTFTSTPYAFIGSGAPGFVASALEAFGAVCVATDFPPTATFTLQGMDLDAEVPVVVGPLDGFAFYDEANFDYVPTLTIPAAESLEREISVRFLPTAAQSYSGTIPVLGGGASISVPVNGNGVNTPPVAVTGPVSGISTTEATTTGTLSAAGCSQPSSMGIEFSTTNGFTPGTGTQVPAAEIGDLWNVQLTELEPCRIYYFRAYATNAGGTHHGVQSTFTTAQPGAVLANAASAIFSTGFTANWEEVPGATGYQLDVSTLPSFAVENFADDLFISEYAEGSGTNKYIEIYNGTGATVDLANYSLRLYSNGSAGISQQSVLSGTLASGATAVYKNSGATWTGDATAINTVVNFNGDDAVALAKGGVNIDVVGTIGSTAVFGADVNLVRKQNIVEGSTTYTMAQWDSYPVNTVSTLGMHTSVVPSASPSFVTGYAGLAVSGASYAVTGLTLGQTYYYRVRTIMGACSGVPSPVITVVTACDPIAIADMVSNSPICSVDALTLSVVVESGETPYTYAWQGTGIFTPNTSSQAVSVSNAASGTYAVLVSNACSSDDAALIVDATPDSDGDGVCDDVDGCPEDAAKTAPGLCGCGVPDTDTDGDGTPDCIDPCDDTTAGQPCDDNDPCTVGDVITNCVCAGTPVPDSDGDGVLDCNDDCPELFGQVGDACDADPTAGFLAGRISEGCACVPMTCTENVTVDLRTDLSSAQASWEILLKDAEEVVCSSIVPVNGITAPITSNCCLPVGCYRLRVMDSGGDGFVNGGYQLRESGANGRRIIDNMGNFNTGSSSAVAATHDNGAFCVPIGNDRPILAYCDKLDWVNDRFIVATENTAVSAQYGVTNTTSGYEFWFFDPNGGYSFRRFRNHATSDGSGSGALRANHFRINGWVNAVATPHIPADVLLNVRIRGRVAGINQPFGPACLFKIDAVRAACPLVELQDNPADSDFSCGVDRSFGGGNNASTKLVAQAPQFIPAVTSSTVRYQFRFRLPGEYPNAGSCIVRPVQTSPTIYLNWSSGDKLKCNTQYQVDVRVSKDGGTTWCVAGSEATCSADPTAWGKVCMVNVTTSNYCPVGADGAPSQLADVQNGAVVLYPNPSRGERVQLRIDHVQRGVNTVRTEIYTLAGERVLDRTSSVVDGLLNTSLELNGELAGGMYLVHITAGEKVFTERLVVQP